MRFPFVRFGWLSGLLLAAPLIWSGCGGASSPLELGEPPSKRVNATPDLCRRDNSCRVAGRCTARNGSCVATSDDDCTRSNRCMTLGHCVARAGRCQAAAPEHCERSSMCDLEARCSLAGNGQCAAGSDAECRAHPRCKLEGACSARDGRCVVSADGCRNSQQCASLGWCTAVGEKCGVTTSEECAASPACKKAGRCANKGGICRPSIDSHCRESEGCARTGHCTLGTKIPLCIIGSEEDCRQSLVCRDGGYCNYSDRRCIHPETGEIADSLPRQHQAPAAGPKASNASPTDGTKGRERHRGRVNGLPRGEVLRVVSRNSPGITRCYRPRLMEDETLAGRIVMEWVVDEDGRVADVTVRFSTVADARVASCLVSVISAMRFPPPPDGSATITYPLIFRPANW